MKIPRYPLQAVLDQREAEKKQARLTLADALRAIEREEQELRRREQARDAHLAEADERRARLYDPDAAGMLPLPMVTRRTDELRYVERQAEEAARAVEQQGQALERARTEAEARRTALIEADRELQAVEKHRDGWLEERRREAARQEQRQTDEVVTARFAAERGGDEGERA